MPKPLNGNGRYMAGLDGLRAIAVFAVIAYHLNFSWASGGLLGVGVFFVLSGYLITDILVSQWKRTGRLELKDFWIRRARRLLPAMLLMLLVVVVWITFSDRSQLPSLRGDAMAAVLYISNWWLIFHKVSYFESFGPPSPLGHLWSLAVEEQFYLLWPLLLALGPRFALRRGKLFVFTLAGVAASVVAMALLFEPGTDPSRVYYGTDTRSFALLIGAALALVWPSSKLSSEKTSPGGRLTLDLAGGLGLLTVLLMIGQTNQYDDSLYRGGMVLLCVATAVLVAALAHPASLINKVLGCTPLRWLGVHSYGIYLWHYPVIVLTSPAVNTEGVDITRALLQVAASIVLAALSWRFIEEPIRHGAVERLWKQVRTGGFPRGRLRVNILVASTSAILVYSLFSLVATASPAPHNSFSFTKHQNNGSRLRKGTDPANGSAAETVSASGWAIGNSEAKMPNDSSTTKESSGASSTNGTTPNESTGNNGPANGSADHKGSKSTDGSTNATDSTQGSGQGSRSKPSEAVPSQSGQGVTAIGDSVMVDIQPYLENLLPGIVIDGQIGRQLSQAQTVVDHLKAGSKLGSRVIIELGTNGSFNKKQLETLLHSLGDVQQIILVNTRVPRPWENVVNLMLEEVASTFPNITLVNWYEASAGKNSFFYKDGVHLRPDGSQFYAALLARAVEPMQATRTATGQ